MQTTLLPRRPARGAVPEAFQANGKRSGWWAPKPPPLGEREGLPVVVGVVERITKNTVLIRAACPYCDRWHQHGHPTAPNPDAGSRVADCGGGVYYVAVVPCRLRVVCEVTP